MTQPNGSIPAVLARPQERTREQLLQEGAQAFMAMLRTVNDLSEQSFTDWNSAHPEDEIGDLDPRDYVAASKVVRASLLINLTSAQPDRAEGYLRALTELVCIVSDGAVPGRDWDPLQSTAAAFGEPARRQ